MKIQILGTGCPKCVLLYENAKKACEDLNKTYELQKITSISEITSYGVMMTPALGIDGIVKSQGKALSVEDIKKIIG